MMRESRVPVSVNVCGQMGGVTSESDSCDESDEFSQDTVELDFEELVTASHKSFIGEDTTSFLPPRERRSICEQQEILVSSLRSQPAPNDEERNACEPRAKAAGVVDRGRLGHPPVDNAFGIAYKPYEGYSRGYHLPSAPAFVDEDEFEQDMSAEFRVVVGTSERRGQPLTTSDIHQKRSNKRAADGDDFHYGDISAEGAEMAQKASCQGELNHLVLKVDGCSTPEGQTFQIDWQINWNASVRRP